MGCSGCSTTSGKPSGCKSNGGCSTGGCNRLNVFDWLSTVPLQDNVRSYGIIEVSFNKGSRKDFYRNQTSYHIKKGDLIAVEGMGGFDIGSVSLSGELVKLQMKKYGIQESEVAKRVLHPATEEEIGIFQKQKEREKEILVRARAIAQTMKLDMKLCEVEIQADGKKGTFFYTADQRVDFREIIKSYAGDFKMKVEMRQIGARQESGKVGGIGSCGRELCCSTWLTDFKSVNTTSARYQNLAINQVKLSGQCGRLKCCLNYELDTYMDALSVFPDHADTLETINGNVTLQKRDIFKNLLWYSYSNNNKQYPLTINRVNEILLMNKKGQKAEELRPVEIEVSINEEGIKSDVGFVNDVGQMSLKTLDKKDKKKQGGGDRRNNDRSSQNKQRNDQPREDRQQPTGQQRQPQKQAQGQNTDQQPQKQAQQPGQQRHPQKQNQVKGTNQQPAKQQGGQQQRQQQRPQGGQQQRPQGNQRQQQGRNKGEEQQPPVTPPEE